MLLTPMVIQTFNKNITSAGTGIHFALRSKFTRAVGVIPYGEVNYDAKNDRNRSRQPSRK
jgi:hypothetical protein